MRPLNLLQKTNQRWKLSASFVSVAVGGIIDWFGDAYVGEAAFWIGGVLIFGGLLFGCFSIKCPDCQARWMWDAINDRDFRKWEIWLLALECCPLCGFPEPVDDPCRPNLQCPRCQQTTYNLDFCDVCAKDLRRSPPTITAHTRPGKPLGT